MLHSEKILAAIAIVKHPNKELFLSSRIKQHPNHYGFTGGKVEKDEHPMDTAIRETLEESGINLRAWAFPGEELYSGPDSSGIIVASYYFKLNPGKIPLQEFGEIMDKIISPNIGEPQCKWASKEELCSGPYKEYNEIIFKTMKQNE